MKKLLASTTAALALTAVAVTGVPGAPGAPESTEAAGCSTWQYKVTWKTGNYQYDPGDNTFSKDGYAWRGYYVNSVYPHEQRVAIKLPGGRLKAGHLMTGQLYNDHKQRVTANMGIRKENLDYVTCW
ncbi:hypothetical protein NF556_00695 [Ornithinimicrobium faecis]|uniref:Peptidase inhibitor family I36 n=1 Tax=Ornithinimicrobium faecis TaxID=2934158 RepID=A0ABY4YTW3_9MICO|nr:hypothetical protein [Ornithinimicrobium sp. HY1793]USQ80214.1 hypothetical protein NF556_00695 [Ornithinimicrobium sp. HY1793]